MVNFNSQICDSSSWIYLFESTSMHELTKRTSITKGLIQNCEKHYWNSILNRQYFTLCHEPINYVSFHCQFQYTRSTCQKINYRNSVLHENEQFTQNWMTITSTRRSITWKWMILDDNSRWIWSGPWLWTMSKMVK